MIRILRISFPLFTLTLLAAFLFICPGYGPARAQNTPDLEAMKNEVNLLCAKARKYQAEGRNAWNRTQNMSNSPEVRRIAQQEVDTLLPLYQQYKDLCLRKKQEYLNIKNASSGGNNPSGATGNVKYENGAYICSRGYVCPFNCICLLGICSPGMERNEYYVCNGYGCRLNGKNCSCAARFQGKPCCTPLSRQ